MKHVCLSPSSRQLSCSAWQIGFCGAQTALQLLLTEELCPFSPNTSYHPLHATLTQDWLSASKK